MNYEDILRDELNVKEVKVGEELSLDTNLTHDLKREGLMREVVRHVQAARKAAGLNVDDRIKLSLQTDDQELAAAINEYKDVIATETLAEAVTSDNYEFKTDVKVEGNDLSISLEKV